MGKEYSTIVQIMEKDDRWKAIAWRLISCKMIAYHVSDEKTVQILSLHFVPSLYFFPGLQSVVTGLVLLFLFERASSPDRRIGTRKKFQWDCLGRYDWCVDCILKSSRGKAQWWSIDYFIPTEDESKCATYQYKLLMLFCVVIACEHFGFSIQVAYMEVRKCDLRYLFVINHTNILFLSTWVSELHWN